MKAKGQPTPQQRGPEGDFQARSQNPIYLQGPPHMMQVQPGMQHQSQPFPRQPRLQGGTPFFSAVAQPQGIRPAHAPPQQQSPMYQSPPSGSMMQFVTPQGTPAFIPQQQQYVQSQNEYNQVPQVVSGPLQFRQVVPQQVAGQFAPVPSPTISQQQSPYGMQQAIYTTQPQQPYYTIFKAPNPVPQQQPSTPPEQKRERRIIQIRDPNQDNKDVTQEILMTGSQSGSGTPNSTRDVSDRSSFSSTPPVNLHNDAGAQFAMQVAATLDSNKPGSNKSSPQTSKSASPAVIVDQVPNSEPKLVETSRGLVEVKVKQAVVQPETKIKKKPQQSQSVFENHKQFNEVLSTDRENTVLEDVKSQTKPKQDEVRQQESTPLELISEDLKCEKPDIIYTEESISQEVASENSTLPVAVQTNFVSNDNALVLGKVRQKRKHQGRRHTQLSDRLVEHDCHHYFDADELAMPPVKKSKKPKPAPPLSMGEEDCKKVAMQDCRALPRAVQTNFVSFDNALAREKARQRRNCQGGRHTQLSDRLIQHDYDDYFDSVEVVKPLVNNSKRPEPAHPVSIMDKDCEETNTLQDYRALPTTVKINSVSFDNSLAREKARRKRNYQGGKHTQLSDRLIQHDYDRYFVPFKLAMSPVKENKIPEPASPLSIVDKDCEKTAVQDCCAFPSAVQTNFESFDSCLFHEKAHQNGNYQGGGHTQLSNRVIQYDYDHYFDPGELEMPPIKKSRPEPNFKELEAMCQRQQHKEHQNRRSIHIKKIEVLKNNQTRNKIHEPQNWEKLVLNISSKSLSDTERSALQKGMKFAIAPQKIPKVEIIAAVEDGIASISDDEKMEIRSQVAEILNRATPPTSNIPIAEYKAIKSLRQDKSRLVIAADKGNCTIVMDRIDYDTKVQALLDDKKTYKFLNRDPTESTERKMNHMLLNLKQEDKIDKKLYDLLRSSDGLSPRFYGLPKIHKPVYPLRPIISFINSPTYNLSKHLTKILKPLTGNTKYTTKNSAEFCEDIAQIQLQEDDELISFNVISLFTSIPIELAIQVAQTRLSADGTLKNRMNLTVTDILKLLDFCLSSAHFKYNGRHYKQIFGTAMGSPVSAVMADMVMENLEERALLTSPVKPKFWKRYVDDVCSAVKQSHTTVLKSHLNSIEPAIQFTVEHKSNNSIAFMDVLLRRDNHGQLSSTIYRNPTHTDRYLSYDSHHPIAHKRAVVKSLMDRVDRLPTTMKGRKQETQRVISTLQNNGYPKRFILKTSQQKIHPEPTRREQRGFSTLPYVKGTSEQIKRLLDQHGVKVALKPINTIGSLFPKPKDPLTQEETRGAVYRIPCKDCEKSYIGETKRKFETRKKEHQKAVSHLDTKKSALAEHHVKTGHNISWSNCTLLRTCNKIKERKIMEAWEINLEPNSMNRDNGVNLPPEYLHLIVQERQRNIRPNSN